LDTSRRGTVSVGEGCPGGLGPERIERGVQCQGGLEMPPARARATDDRGRPAGAALVDEQDAIVGDRATLPAGRRRGRTGRLAAGTALLEDQIGAIEPIRRGKLAAEERDLLAVRAA
jgi:hypothetical protein